MSLNDHSQSTAWPNHCPNTLLVGAGVVGQAIAEAHLVRQVPFVLADRDEQSVLAATSRWKRSDWRFQRIDLPSGALANDLFAMSAEFLSSENARSPDNAETESNDGDSSSVSSTVLVIESIVEDLAAKQRLFNSIQESLGRSAILCSNTSTFTIHQIAEGVKQHPEQILGLHFFMPVQSRAAVEVVAGPICDERSLSFVKHHAKRIGKHVLSVGDGPGFVVNRMLSPYLNQSLCLLSAGATADQIERAAIAFGMPVSPFELIDWIGASTMYHSGKAFLKAFPGRLDPSPMVPALIKRKRLGRATGKGLYDYETNPPQTPAVQSHQTEPIRSDSLAEESLQIAETYRTSDVPLTDLEVLQLLTIPMWIEAKKLIQEGIAESMDLIDTAMSGGLGYNSHTRWSGFYAELGEEMIDGAMRRFGDRFKSMRAY